MNDPRYRDDHAPTPPTYRAYTKEELTAEFKQTDLTSIVGAISQSPTDELELLREWARYGSDEDKWVPGLTISESVLRYIRILEEENAELQKEVEGWRGDQ